jgi:hypothetical protein
MFRIHEGLLEGTVITQFTGTSCKEEVKVADTVNLGQSKLEHADRQPRKQMMCG